MPVIQEFIELLLNLQSLNNDCRNEAESIYNTLDGTVKFEYLLQVISDKETDSEVRIFGSVLCRRLLNASYKDSFFSLSTELQSFTKEQLLLWIINENDVNMREKVIEIVIEIAKQQFDDNGNMKWVELVSFIFESCLLSSEPKLLLIGLHLFGSLPLILGDKLLFHIDSLCDIFTHTLAAVDVNKEPQLLEIRKSAVKTFSSFISSRRDLYRNLAALTPLVSLMLQATADCIVAQPDNDTCMKALIDMADSGSDLLTDTVKDVLIFCKNVLYSGNVKKVQKHLAVEVVLSLIENCPATLRKCLTYLQSFEEVLSFNKLDKDAEKLNNEAKKALHRIACAIKEKPVFEDVTNRCYSSDGPRHNTQSLISNVNFEGNVIRNRRIIYPQDVEDWDMNVSTKSSELLFKANSQTSSHIRERYPEYKTSASPANDNQTLHSNIYSSKRSVREPIPCHNFSEGIANIAHSVKNRRLSKNTYVVLCDFYAKSSDEIDLKAGWKVSTINCTDPDWWIGMCYGQVGYFPSRYVKEIEIGDLVWKLVKDIRLNDVDGNTFKLCKGDIVVQRGSPDGESIPICIRRNINLWCPIENVRMIFND